MLVFGKLSIYEYETGGVWPGRVLGSGRASGDRSRRWFFHPPAELCLGWKKKKTTNSKEPSHDTTLTIEMVLLCRDEDEFAAARPLLLMPQRTKSIGPSGCRHGNNAVARSQQAGYAASKKRKKKHAASQPGFLVWNETCSCTRDGRRTGGGGKAKQGFQGGQKGKVLELQAVGSVAGRCKKNCASGILAPCNGPVVAAAQQANVGPCPDYFGGHDANTLRALLDDDGCLFRLSVGDSGVALCEPSCV